MRKQRLGGGGCSLFFVLFREINHLQALGLIFLASRSGVLDKTKDADINALGGLAENRNT